MKKAAALLCLILLASPASAFSLREDLKKGFGLAEKKNLKTALYFAAAALVSLSVDAEVRDFVQRNRNDTLSGLAELGNSFGEGWAVLPVLASAAGLAHIEGNRELLNTAVEAAEAFLVAGVVVSILKAATMRERPSAGRGSFSFRWGAKSFPSGHTAVSFAVFTVIARRYKIPALYLLPALTAFARLYKDAHWLSDVVAGAGIGYIAGRSIVELHRRAAKVKMAFCGSRVMVKIEF